jgi:hypothetical protein
MATQIGELFVKIGADVGSFTKGLTSAGDGMKGFSDRLKSDIESGNISIKSLGANMVKAAGPAGIMAGAVAAVGVAVVLAGKQLYDFTMEVERGKDNLADLASEAGLSMETISGLQLVAMQSGMSIDELAGSFKTLGKNVIAAQDPLSNQADVFKQLGISITDASGNLKPSIDLFKEIATAVSKLPDGFQKSTIEMQLFGGAGVKLNEILNKGGAEIDAAIRRGIELAVVTKDDADAAQELIDANAELSLSWIGLKNELAGGLNPALTKFISNLTYFIEECKNAELTIDMFKESLASGETPMFSIIGVVYQMSRAFGFLADAVKEAYTDYLYWVDIASGENPLSRYEREAQANADASVRKSREAARAAAEAKAKAVSGGDTPANGSTGTAAGGSSGPTPAEIAAEEHAALMALEAEWDAQHLKDVEGAWQYEQDQALLELETLMEQGEIELQVIKDKNDAIIAEERRKAEQILAWETMAWQGGTDIMADALGRMIAGQKVSGKEMLKATGQMFGGILSQMGTELIGEGIKTYFTGVGYASNPYTAAIGANMMAAGGTQMAEGMGLKVLGSTLGALSSGGSSGGGGGGGGGGKAASAPVASAPGAAAGAAALPGGTATINIVGGDSAIFSGAQVRTLIESINDELAKGMTLVVA